MSRFGRKPTSNFLQSAGVSSFHTLCACRNVARARAQGFFPPPQDGLHMTYLRALPQFKF